MSNKFYQARLGLVVLIIFIFLIIIYLYFILRNVLKTIEVDDVLVENPVFVLL